MSRTETDRLFAVLRRLRERGLGIIYISHRLEEIFALADRVTVLRDGRHGRVGAGRRTRPGRAHPLDGGTRRVGGVSGARTSIARAPPVLDVAHLSAPPRFADVSLTVREGEIVGLAGLVGAGRTSTALALAGAAAAGGDVRVNGQPVHFTSPADAIDRGVAYVTEDRKARGLFPADGRRREHHDHVSVDVRARRACCRSRASAAAAAAARDYDVRAATLAQPVATLSGGNQQKVLLARATLKRPVVLLLDEPTRGVDVGARAEIYALMNRLTREGLAILMISSDLPEVLGMSDRVVVMREGRTRGELTRAEATPERVMALATAA